MQVQDWIKKSNDRYFLTISISKRTFVRLQNIQEMEKIPIGVFIEMAIIEHGRFYQLARAINREKLKFLMN